MKTVKSVKRPCCFAVGRKRLDDLRVDDQVGHAACVSADLGVNVALLAPLRAPAVADDVAAQHTQQNEHRRTHLHTEKQIDRHVNKNTKGLVHPRCIPPSERRG